MNDFLKHTIGRYFIPLILLVVFSAQTPLHSQNMTKQEIGTVLDSLYSELFEFNYWDSLNNKPLFFTFPFDVRKVSLEAEKAGYADLYKKAEEIRGRFYSYNGVYKKVLQIYDSAGRWAEQRGDLNGKARFTYLKGNEYRRNEWNDVAIEYFNTAYGLADSLGDEKLKGRVVYTMASTYATMHEDETALLYYRSAYDMSAAQKDTAQLIQVMSSMGIAYGRQGMADSALFYGQRCYDLSTLTNNIIGFRRGLNSLIQGYQLKGEHKKVFELTDEMSERIQASGEIGYMITPLNNRSKSHFATGNMAQALADVNQSLEYSLKSGWLNGQLNAMNWKIELLKSMGVYDSALVVSAELHALKDSLYHVEIRERLTSMTENFEIRERQNRIENLVQVNEINSRRLLYRNMAIVALVMVFLVMIILLLLINRRKLEKEKYALQEAQDKLLRSQLNPHFLFNALSSIQLFLINKGQGKEALEYLSKFAKLMRRILENSRESLVSLEDEVATLRHYLDLQKIRFDNKFEYKITIETEEDTGDIMIPPMFAQPFIENSLEHGIANRDDGVIQIWFKETSDGLSFKVEDNGIGISRSMRTNKEASHKSLATIITRDRINILRRQLKKRISFDIRDKMNEREEITGTEVIFELPVIYR